MKKTLIGRLLAVVTAFVVAFAGVSASAGTLDTGSKNSASESSKDKCKKKKGKEKKKCKKEQQPSDPGTEEPSEPEEPGAEEPTEPEAPAGFVPGRVVELVYTGPAIGSSEAGAVNPFGVLFPVNFVAGAGEVLATIEIVDDASPNAEAGFSSDTDGDGLNDTGFQVCGSTPEPIEMVPGQQYNVFPYLLPSTGCTDGAATSGTIIVTFNKV